MMIIKEESEMKTMKKIGRPKGSTKENNKVQTIQVRVNDELREELQRLADEKSISLSSLIRMWLLEKVK